MNTPTIPPAGEEIEAAVERLSATLDRAYGALAQAHSRIHTLPRSSDTELADRLLAARAQIEQCKSVEVPLLAAHLPRPVDEEPVAWRCGHLFTSYREAAENQFKNGYDVQPLYTRPTPSGDGLVACLENSTVALEFMASKRSGEQARKFREQAARNRQALAHHKSPASRGSAEGGEDE